MSYYKNTVESFLVDLNSGRLLNHLSTYKNEYTKEYVSWENSLKALSEILVHLDEKKNLYIFIEYHLMVYRVLLLICGIVLLVEVYQVQDVLMVRVIIQLV